MARTGQHNVERVVWAGACGLLMAGLLVMSTAYNHRLHALEQRETASARTAEAAQRELVAARAEPGSESGATKSDAPGDHPSRAEAEPADEQQLRERLAVDLQKHPELIPAAGELGGKMFFSGADQLRLLGSHWVYAPFEDGHVEGGAIFRYEMADDGSITWKLIDSSTE